MHDFRYTGFGIRGVIAGVGGLLAVLAVPKFVSPYMVISLNSILMYMVLTVSWAAFCGPTNYISLASAAFFGVGMYTSATLGTAIPLPLLTLLGGVLSFVLAFLVGLSSLRLRGMYFTIFTFGLSELIRHAVLWWEVNITGTVGRVVFAVGDVTIYYSMLTIALATIIAAYCLKVSRFGLALRGIGESEEAADHIGINVDLVKIINFAVTSFFMGCAGVVMRVSCAETSTSRPIPRFWVAGRLGAAGEEGVKQSFLCPKCEYNWRGCHVPRRPNVTKEEGCSDYWPKGRKKEPQLDKLDKTWVEGLDLRGLGKKRRGKPKT